jgi:hypothetical protein
VREKRRGPLLIQVQMDEIYVLENGPLEVHSHMRYKEREREREREREEEETMYLSICRWMKFTDDDWMAQK